MKKIHDSMKIMTQITKKEMIFELAMNGVLLREQNLQVSASYPNTFVQFLNSQNLIDRYLNYLFHNK